MADVEVKARVSVDTGNTAQGVKKAKDEVKGLGDEVKKASGGNFSNLKNSLSQVGPAAMEAAKGSSMLNTALNILKANPIILVVSVLVGIIVVLMEKFKRMEGVSDALNKAWGSLSGVLNMFMNKILTPLINGFVKLVELFTNGVLEVLDALGISSKESGERLGELTDALDDLEDAEKNSAIATAESNRKLQEAREIAGDANVPIRERIAALKEAARIEKEELDKVVEINRQKASLTMESIAMELGARSELIAAIREGSLEQLKAARLELMAMQNVDKEKLRSIDAMIIAAEDAAAQSAKVGKKTQSQISSLEKEEDDKRKAAAAERDKKAKEAQAKREAEHNARMEKIEADHQLRKAQIENERRIFGEKEKQEKLEADMTFLQNKASKEIAIIAQTEKDKNDLKAASDDIAIKSANLKEQLKKAEIDGLNAIADIIGQQTEAGKAISVATTLFSTYESAQLAYRSQMSVPDPSAPVRAAIAAASAVLQGLARVKAIVGVKIPGRGGGGGYSTTDSSLTANAPLSPAMMVNRTSLNASQIQAIGNAAKDGVFKGFVLESDIANQQERITRISRAARLG